MISFNKKTVVLGVTGGIAAYKACDLCSRLVKHGLDVFVVMTRNATQFITPLTFETLTGRPVAVDTFTRAGEVEIEHISLAKRADVFVIAPASANIIGKLASGIADDMLSTTAMACTKPLIIAPAMNTNMMLSGAVTENLRILRERGAAVVDAATGRLACGDTGVGKLADVNDILDCVLASLCVKSDYLGKHVLVTAGPTREPIDPVRYISNRSSGKMGYHLAAAARDRGAEVTLVSGVTELPDVPGVKTIRVETTHQMYDAVMNEFDSCDMVVKAAAPADYTVRRVSEFKMKTDEMLLELRPTPDILKALGERKGEKILVGFAAETHDLSMYAMQKLQNKSLDMIVANDVSRKGVGFDYDTNAVTIYKKDSASVNLQLDTKQNIAHRVLDHAAEMFKS